MTQASRKLMKSLALGALISVLFLLVMGPFVRVSGAGLGCPDWPKCWGCWFPPSSVEEVDFDKLNFEKFERKSGQEALTVEKLKSEFSQKKAWIEYVNRLSSLPVGFYALALLIFAHVKGRKYIDIILCAWLAFILILVNAWLGARVVLTGLQEGLISAHLAMAFVLLAVDIYVVYRVCSSPNLPTFAEFKEKYAFTFTPLAQLGGVLLILMIAEGMLGVQIRELTDRLAKDHATQDQTTWLATLKQYTVFFVHRSGSWLIFAAVIFWAYLQMKTKAKLSLAMKLLLILVFAQMVLGIIMSHWGIYDAVQVLHVVFSSWMYCLILWLFMQFGFNTRTTQD